MCAYVQVYERVSWTEMQLSRSQTARCVRGQKSSDYNLEGTGLMMYLTENERLCKYCILFSCTYLFKPFYSLIIIIIIKFIYTALISKIQTYINSTYKYKISPRFTNKNVQWFTDKNFTNSIFFYYNAKGENSLAKGDLTTTVLSLRLLTWLEGCKFDLKILSSQSFCDSRNDYLSLSLSVCLSVLLLKPISR